MYDPREVMRSAEFSNEFIILNFSNDSRMKSIETDCLTRGQCNIVVYWSPRKSWPGRVTFARNS